MRQDDGNGGAVQGEGDRSAGDEPQRKKSFIPRRFMPLIAIAILALSGFLLYRTLSRYSFGELVDSVAAIPLTRLGLAGLFAAGSYLCLTGFDTLAVRYVGKDLPYPRVALTSFVSLSIGHSLGFAAFSSGAVRYRFYSRWGLSLGDVAKVILFCGLTVGIGMIILGGLALLLRPELAGAITRLSRPFVIGLGVACLALAGLYLALAAVVKRPLRFRKWSLEMPSFRLAVGQAVVGTLNFALVAACLHQALIAVADVSFGSAVTAYVIANAGVLVSHVPGGLGVIEAVLLFLLPQDNLIGALLVFRFVYFLVPLAIGGVVFAISELLLRRRRGASATGRT